MSINDNKIECLECHPHKLFGQITNAHLNKVHNMNPEQYKRIHPNAILFRHSINTKMEMSKIRINNFKSGKIKLWNDGKTKETDSRIAEADSKRVKTVIMDGTFKGSNNPMFGVHLTGRYHQPLSKDVLKKRSDKVKAEKTYAGINNPMFGKKSWNHGLTSENDKRVANNSASISKTHSNPNSGYNSNKYKSRGGRGAKISLEYYNGIILLRSSWEFVAAIYYLLRGWQLNYEKEIIIYEGKTYISDFSFGKSIYEIKGYDTNNKYINEERAFIESGYKFKFIIGEDIKRYKIYIRSKGINIDSILDVIREYHGDNKIYTFNTSGMKLR